MTKKSKGTLVSVTREEFEWAASFLCGKFGLNVQQYLEHFQTPQGRQEHYATVCQYRLLKKIYASLIKDK